MSELRFKVVEEAIKRKAVCMPAPAERASEYFGMYVFNEDKMRKYLPKKTYEALFETMKHGKALSRRNCRQRRIGYETVGDGHGRHALYALVSAAYGAVRPKNTTLLSSTTARRG